MARGDFFTLEKKKVTVYSDFLVSFDRNPTTDNLALNTNEASIKRQVRNIVLTQTGERFYDSTKGTKARGSLFDLYDPVRLEVLRLDIHTAITRFVPAASPLLVEIMQPVDNLERHGINVKISFGIVNVIDEPISMDIFVEKVR